MNILIIPSWYPTTKNPINGIFIKEQSFAIAEENINKANVIIAKWDNDCSFLNFRRPYKLPEIIINYFSSKEEDIQITNNLFEYFTPTLAWTHKLPFGGPYRIEKAIEKSFKRALLKFGNIDIIHAHVSYPAGYIACKLSTKYNIPYVLTEHMSPFPFSSLIKHGKPIDEIIKAFNFAKRIIAVSKSLCNRIKSYNLKCTDIVPNFVDEKRFYILNKKREKFTFLTLCIITEQKGIDLLLYSISNLEKNLKLNIDFLIGGDGPLLKEYQTLAKKLQINNVYWLGQVNREEVPTLFASCHAFVMPSRHETFGVVYAEAIASGLPVIATKCGGPEDIVNETNGILIDKEDIEGLSYAIKYIYENYHKYSAEKIRTDFENRFSKRVVISKIMKIYNEVVENYR